jgi:hypothetical protein
MLPVKPVIACAIFSSRLALAASARRRSCKATMFRARARLRLPGFGGATVGPNSPMLALISFQKLR